MCLCVCCVVCVQRVQNVSATPATLKAVEVQRPRRPRGCWVRQLPRPQPHSSSAGPGQGHGGPRAAWLRPPRCHLRGFVGDDLPCAGDPVRAGRRSRGGAARTVRVPRYPARGLHAAPTPMQRLGGFSHDPPPPGPPPPACFLAHTWRLGLWVLSPDTWRRTSETLSPHLGFRAHTARTQPHGRGSSGSSAE